MFNIQKCYIIPTECIYVFGMDLRTNRDLFPTDSLLIDFMTGTKYVYCAVRTESLDIIQVIRNVFTFIRRTT